MNENPYESPTAFASDMTAEVVISEERRRLIQILRADLVLLLIGGLYNFLMFTPAPDSARNATFWLLPTIFNTMLIVAVSVTVWYRGLVILEWIALVVRSCSKRKIDDQLWLGALYDGIRRSPACAAAGMLVWGAWVWGFYVARLDFMLISIPTGIIAHGLGAIFYVPIFVQWYRIWRASPL